MTIDIIIYLSLVFILFFAVAVLALASWCFVIVYNNVHKRRGQAPGYEDNIYTSQVH